MITTQKSEKQERRRMRIRRKVVGTAERPRLCVRRSGRHLYAQVVDDAAGRSLAAATTNTKANKDGSTKNFANIKNAKAIGQAVAEKAKAAGVKKVVFDRGGHPYHGIVKAVAEAEE